MGEGTCLPCTFSTIVAASRVHPLAPLSPHSVLGALVSLPRHHLLLSLFYFLQFLFLPVFFPLAPVCWVLSA